MLSRTGHPIMAATDPRMYEYFSTNDEILHLDMIGATTFMISKTPQSLKILEKVNECALIQGCMGPWRSTIYCNGAKLARKEYAKCHRYDQSALSLSLAQCSTNISDYLGLSDTLSVERM